MITPQDIREKVFEAVVFNGYDKSEVDDFLDTVAGDLSALIKENAAMKAKMKVLVDKIEEYRENESALNMAMLSAQKLSVQIENDARARATAIVNGAEAQAAATLSSIDERLAKEESRLQAAKITTAKFLDSAIVICHKQLDRLEAISANAHDELGDSVADDAMRIPEEEAGIDTTPVVEPDPIEAGNTQVFSFSKDI